MTEQQKRQKKITRILNALNGKFGDANIQIGNLDSEFFSKELLLGQGTEDYPKKLKDIVIPILKSKKVTVDTKQHFCSLLKKSYTEKKLDKEEDFSELFNRLKSENEYDNSLLKEYIFLTHRNILGTDYYCDNSQLAKRFYLKENGEDTELDHHLRALFKSATSDSANEYTKKKITLEIQNIFDFIKENEKNSDNYIENLLKDNGFAGKLLEKIIDIDNGELANNFLSRVYKLSVFDNKQIQALLITAVKEGKVDVGLKLINHIKLKNLTIDSKSWQEILSSFKDGHSFELIKEIKELPENASNKELSKEILSQKKDSSDSSDSLDSLGSLKILAFLAKDTDNGVLDKLLDRKEEIKKYFNYLLNNQFSATEAEAEALRYVVDHLKVLILAKTSNEETDDRYRETLYQNFTTLCETLEDKANEEIVFSYKTIGFMTNIASIITNFDQENKMEITEQHKKYFSYLSKKDSRVLTDTLLERYDSELHKEITNVRSEIAYPSWCYFLSFFGDKRYETQQYKLEALSWMLRQDWRAELTEGAKSIIEADSTESFSLFLKNPCYHECIKSKVTEEYPSAAR